MKQKSVIVIILESMNLLIIAFGLLLTDLKII